LNIAPTNDNPTTPVIDDETLGEISSPITSHDPDDDDETDPAPGVDPGPSAYAIFTDSIDSFNTNANLIGLSTLDATPDLNMPPAGSADFSGFMTVNIDPSDRFSAEMTLNLDFDNNTIEASNGQFFRLQENPDLVTAYTGDLLFIRGAIGEDAVNDLDLDARGTLAHDDSRLHVSANLSGMLLGENAEGLILRTPVGFGERFTVTLDGEMMENTNVIISAMPD